MYYYCHWSFRARNQNGRPLLILLTTLHRNRRPCPKWRRAHAFRCVARTTLDFACILQTQTNYMPDFFSSVAGMHYYIIIWSVSRTPPRISGWMMTKNSHRWMNEDKNIHYGQSILTTRPSPLQPRESTSVDAFGAQTMQKIPKVSKSSLERLRDWW